MKGDRMKGKISTELLIIIIVIALALVGSIILTRSNVEKDPKQEVEFLFLEDDSEIVPLINADDGSASNKEIPLSPVHKFI
jgi:Na+-transporting NADH:ubiquinone oxidoreductase subunit NqrC